MGKADCRIQAGAALDVLDPFKHPFNPGVYLGNLRQMGPIAHRNMRLTDRLGPLGEVIGRILV